MSNIYIQEPATNGKVLLDTTCGEFEIELWSREVPFTCRNFVQRCLEGHYDGTIFHRIIPNFIAQGGHHDDQQQFDTNIANVKSFKFKSVESHQRLRFVRRGLVACAATQNDFDDDSVLSVSARNEIFITLEACPELQGKHAIFGKLAGNTLYNALKFQDLQLDANNRPLFPPIIRKATVLNNPFADLNDIVLVKKSDSTKLKPATDPEDDHRKKPFSSRNCLSFASEDADEAGDEEPSVKRPKRLLKSAHDFDDPVLLNQQTASSDTFSRGRVILESKSNKNAQTMSGDVEDDKCPPIDDLKMRRPQAETPKMDTGGSSANVLARAADDFTTVSKESKDTSISATSEYGKLLSEFSKKNLSVKNGKKDKNEREHGILARLAQYRNKLNTSVGQVELSAPLRTDNDADISPTAGFDEQPVDPASFLSHMAKFLPAGGSGADGDDDGGLIVVNGRDKSVAARDASMKRGVEDYGLDDPRNPLNKQRREDAGRESRLHRTKHKDPL